MTDAARAVVEAWLKDFDLPIYDTKSMALDSLVAALDAALAQARRETWQAAVNVAHNKVMDLMDPAVSTKALGVYNAIRAAADAALAQRAEGRG